MTRFLLATDSVHTTAVLCDYLTSRLEAGDAVDVLAVTGQDLDEHDGADALNVAGVRLDSTQTVDPVTVTGDPATEILDHAQGIDADEIVVGARGGDPNRSHDSVGGTTIRLLEASERPVVVVPTPPVA